MVILSLASTCLPPQTGASFIYPGPRTHDGILAGVSDPEESRTTLAVVNQMIADLDEFSRGRGDRGFREKNVIIAERGSGQGRRRDQNRSDRWGRHPDAHGDLILKAPSTRIAPRGDRAVLGVILAFATGYSLLLLVSDLLPFVDLPFHLGVATVVRGYGEAGNQFSEYFSLHIAGQPNIFPCKMSWAV